jgi:hypothetical protein
MNDMTVLDCCLSQCLCRFLHRSIDVVDRGGGSMMLVKVEIPGLKG